MALLTVIDVLMMVVGGVGIIYQAICVIMSLFSKPVHFRTRRWTSATPC